MENMQSVIKGARIYENHLKQDDADYTSATLSLDLDVYDRLSKELEDVEGQAHVIEAIKEGLYCIKKKKQSKGPLAVFTFVGPPATGKSMIAEKIGEALGIPTLRLDMSAYCTKDSILDLVGSNKVFSSAQEGILTSYVHKHGFVIIILEEIDQAHITVKNEFYQIFQEGETDDLCMCKTVDFRNVIFIVTTNVCSSIYNSSIASYNNSQVPQSAIIKAMSAETNPDTNEPYLPEALVSRLAAGRIFMFNKLRPEHIHKIVKGAILREIEVYREIYRVKVDVDVDELARTFIFELGENGDIRALKQMVRGFFETNFLRSACLAREKGSKSFFTHIKCDFRKENSTDEVRELFFNKRRSRIAVMCGKDERPIFDGVASDTVETLYMDKSFKLNNILDLDPSAIVIGVNDQDDLEAKELFREASLQDKIPVYVYSNNNIGRLPFLYYTDKGATDCYYPGSNKGSLDEWVGGIVDGISLSSITHAIFRANKVMTYDVAIDHDEEKREITLGLTNYGIQSAMSASDSEKFVVARSIPNVSFDDIIGVKEAKNEVKTVVGMLKKFKQMKRDGIRVPRGLLLEGKPGTGKTMLAKALAAECKMPFIEKNGSEFLHKHVGVGAETMRELFASARRYAPAVIFIDEVDAFAGNREAMSGFRTDDVLNAFLSEMDGFSDHSDTPVFVIAATNFSSDRENTKLDPAFLRRFDRSIHIDLPGLDERREFISKNLERYSSGTVSEGTVKSLSKRSVGMSLADINLIIQNAIRRCYDGNSFVPLTDGILKEAYESYSAGGVSEQKESALRHTAIHEAGHAVVAHVLGLKPIYTTIVGRKNYGGYVSFSNEDASTYSKDFLLNKICCAYAGRVAEVLEYGQDGITTGIAGDIKVATDIAELMVAEYGMIGSDIMYYSEQRRANDGELTTAIRALLLEQYRRCQTLIEQNYEKVKTLANVLLEKNSLDEEEIVSVLEEGRKE